MVGPVDIQHITCSKYPMARGLSHVETRPEHRSRDAKTEKGDDLDKETNMSLHEEGNWHTPRDDSVLLKNGELSIIIGGLGPPLATSKSVPEFQMRDANLGELYRSCCCDLDSRTMWFGLWMTLKSTNLWIVRTDPGPRFCSSSPGILKGNLRFALMKLGIRNILP